MVGIVLDAIVLVMVILNVGMVFVMVMKLLKHVLLIVYLQESVKMVMFQIVQMMIVVLNLGLEMALQTVKISNTDAI